MPSSNLLLFMVLFRMFQWCVDLSIHDLLETGEEQAEDTSNSPKRSGNYENNANAIGKGLLHCSTSRSENCRCDPGNSRQCGFIVARERSNKGPYGRSG